MVRISGRDLKLFTTERSMRLLPIQDYHQCRTPSIEGDHLQYDSNHSDTLFTMDLDLLYDQHPHKITYHE